MIDNFKTYNIFKYKNNQLIINCKLNNIYNSSNKLNNILNIKNINYDHINIPMIDSFEIILYNEKYIINLNDFYNYNYKHKNIIFLPVKKKYNMEFRDIIISIDNLIFSICIYKLKNKLYDISHGLLIIFKSNNYIICNSPDTISYTKLNNDNY